MDPVECGQSFLGLMASMHQGKVNFLSSMLDSVDSNADLHSAPVVEADLSLPAEGESTPMVKRVRRASTERREVFFEAMPEKPAERSPESSTPNLLSDSEAVISDFDSNYMYDSSASGTSRRRKRRWVGTDLLVGFSIRHGTSQTNTKKDQRNMQEFECQRAGKPRLNQKKTTRCGCPARMRLLRCSTGSYYVKTLVGEHNHSLVESCGEKCYLFSHKSIDDSTKEMIRHLRENNVSLSKVNCIMGSMHGSMSAIPFTKKALRNV